jgi:hypothetical protein
VPCGAADFVAGERGDHPLDLPPVAEAHDIARVAAALGARRGLEPGIVAEAVDQLGRVGERGAAGDEGGRPCAPVNPRPFRDCRQSRQRFVDHDRGGARALCSAMGRAMQHPPPWPADSSSSAILAGFVWGLAIGNPMKGVLIGTGVGSCWRLRVADRPRGASGSTIRRPAQITRPMQLISSSPQSGQSG